MRKVMIALTCLAVATPCFAQLNHTIGVGIPYGVMGFQIAKTNDQHRIRGAIGFLGLSAGYDYLHSDEFALGVSYTVSLAPIYSLNLSYTPTGQQQGIVLGLDLNHIPSNNENGWFGRPESTSFISFNIGYRY